MGVLELLQGSIATNWPYSSLPITFVLCSGGLRNILYAFGLGYGFSMSASSLLTLWVDRPRLVSPSGMPTLPGCGAFLYLAYGARLATFLFRRQRSASYQPKLKSVAEKSERMPLVARLCITSFVAVSQTLYALPLHLVSTLEAPNDELTVPSAACVALAAAGLVLEAAADEQKLASKEQAPAAPVMSGLYRSCRHPNYLGEIAFHFGICGLLLAPASTGSVPWPQVALAAASPLFMISVMLGAAQRLDKDQAERQRGDEKYEKWVQSTRSLIPTFF